MAEDSRQRGRILVVEDEGIVAADIEACLEEVGFQVTGVAASADDAIGEASKRCPDLVLMDIRIQGALDGIEAAELLRRRFGVPVVYLTAHGDRDTMERARATQPFGFLLKPFKTAELANAVQIALARAQREAWLCERERWFATALGSIGDAVLSTDGKGRLRFMNRAAETLTGWSAEEALGQPVGEIVKLATEKTREPLENSVLRALESGEATASRSGLLLPKAGEPRPVSDLALPIGGEGGPFGAVLILKDQAQRSKLRQRIELGGRLESLGAITAAIAHEINNPLTAVTANLDFALGQLEEAGEEQTAGQRLAAVTDALHDARLGAGHMARVVADLQAFSSPTAASPGPIDLRRPLKWAVDIASYAMRDRGSVCCGFGEVPLVQAEETRLGQVFVNLLINAAQAIAPGAAEANAVRITTCTDAAGRAVVEIQDSGCGMEADLLPRIFEPFFTTRQAERGSGLGLSICQGIVHSLGGQIEVESKVGHGSTFRVLLPAAGARAEAPAAAPGRRASVLVIDDDPMIRRIVERALQPVHDVTAVAAAAEGICLLAEGQPFDIILCDLAMPAMNGVDFYEHLSRHHPEYLRRVILLSGGIFTARMAELLESAAVRCLAKPFELADLKRAIAESLA